MKFVIKNALFSLSLTVLLSFLFLICEPSISMAVDSQFIVTQVISAEIAIRTPATNVSMASSIAGITGGTSNGSTSIVVYTNNNTGYSMTIQASSSPAMQGNAFGGHIDDYTPAVVGTPDYTFSVPTGSEFAYSVSAASTTDLNIKFLDNGATLCGTGSADTGGSNTCWYGASTTATQIINRTTATNPSGATTTIYFKVLVNANSDLIEDTYTATSTLTATMN